MSGADDNPGNRPWYPPAPVAPKGWWTPTKAPGGYQQPPPGWYPPPPPSGYQQPSGWYQQPPPGWYPPAPAPVWYPSAAPGGGPKPKAGTARTGPLPLHPMTLSDILDGAFKLFRANARTIAIVVAVLVVPFQIIGALAERNLLGGKGLLTAFNDPSVSTSGGRSSAQVWASVGVTVINLLLLPFVAGAVAKIVAASYIGEELTARQALRAVWHRAGSLFGAWWIWHPIEIIGFALCVLPGLAWMTMFVMVAPVIVIEDLGPIQGLKRSWRLAKRRFWPTLGISLLAGLMAYVLGQMLSAVPTLGGLFIGLRWGWILLAVGNSAVAILVTPLVSIVATLLYFDVRIRTEGFDLQIIAAGLAGESR
jgi:hypothetical protein